VIVIYFHVSDLLPKSVMANSALALLGGEHRGFCFRFKFVAAPVEALTLILFVSRRLPILRKPVLELRAVFSTPTL
jgi:hypothetical protein